MHQSAIANLQYRPEVSTATTGIRYVREAAVMIRNGVDVYATRQCLPSGLLVGFASVADVRMLLVAAWFLAFYCFTRIAAHRGYSPLSAISLGIGNPLLLTLMGQSFAIVDQMLIWMAIYGAWRGHVSVGCVLVGAASSLHIHNAFYLLPVLMFQKKHQLARTFIFTSSLILSTLLGYHLSHSAHPMDYVYTTTGCQLQLHDLTPNLGLWWYMFTEMFDHFRPLFLAVFNLLVVALIVPAAIRLRGDPLFLAWFVSSVLTVMRPYPTVADYGSSLWLLLLQPQLMVSCGVLLKWALLSATAMAYLVAVVWYYWMVQGTGNSNFYYAATLAVNAIVMVVMVAVTSAWMRRAVVDMNPDVKGDNCVLYQK